MTAIKVIKVLGTSDQSWSDAAEEAVVQASETINDVRGVDVQEWTATVDDGQISEYRAGRDRLSGGGNVTGLGLAIRHPSRPSM